MDISDARNALNKKPRQWTIAHKIGGIASVLILFILALLLYSIITLRDIQGELKEIAALDVPLTELTNKIEIEQLETQITLDQILLLAQRKHTAEVDKKLADAKARLRLHSDALDKHITKGIKLSTTGFTEHAKPMFKEISNALRDVQKDAAVLHSVLFSFVKNVETGAFPTNTEIDSLLTKEVILDKKLLTLIKKIEQFTNREIHTLQNHEHIFLMVNTSLGVAGVLLGIFLSTMIIIGIRTNLFRLTQRVTEVTQAIAENRAITGPVTDIESSDEFGQLAQNLDNMIGDVSTDLRKRDDLARHLQHMATTDRLTGAFNRLKWEEYLEREVARIGRSHEDLSMIIFDIDHFKKVNDTYGHDAGDHVLIEVVKTVSDNLRAADGFYRIGGEEFTIRAPATTIDQVSILADKIRKSIERHSFNTVGQITISMGYAQFWGLSDDGAKMLKRADQALYRAKESGRNKVCLEAEEVVDA